MNSVRFIRNKFRDIFGCMPEKPCNETSTKHRIPIFLAWHREYVIDFIRCFAGTALPPLRDNLSRLCVRNYRLGCAQQTPTDGGKNITARWGSQAHPSLCGLCSNNTGSLPSPAPSGHPLPQAGVGNESGCLKFQCSRMGRA